MYGTNSKSRRRRTQVRVESLEAKQLLSLPPTLHQVRGGISWVSPGGPGNSTPPHVVGYFTQLASPTPANPAPADAAARS
jgi:hypothetical protein